MSKFKVKGRVVKFLKPLVNDKIKKATVWIETDETYPVNLAIDYIIKVGDSDKEKALKAFENLKINSIVEFDVNARSNEYQEKAYTSLTAWKFTSEGGLPETPKAETKKKGMAPNTEFESQVPPPVADDDLPF